MVFRGYRRVHRTCTDWPLQYWYGKRQEFLFVDISLAEVYRGLDRKADADALIARIVSRAAVDHNIIPEMYVSVPCTLFPGEIGDPLGARPMVGYGAGAYILDLLDRRQPGLRLIRVSRMLRFGVTEASCSGRYLRLSNCTIPFVPSANIPCECVESSADPSSAPFKCLDPVALKLQFPDDSTDHGQMWLNPAPKCCRFLEFGRQQFPMPVGFQPKHIAAWKERLVILEKTSAESMLGPSASP